MGGSCESTGRRNSASSTAAAAASTKSVSQAEALATQQLRRSGDHKHVLSSNSSVLKCQKNWTILIFFFRGCHFLYNNLGGLFRPQYFTHCLSIQSSMLVQFRPPLIPNETPAQPWKHRANGFVWKEVPKVPECMVQVVHTQNQSCKIPTRRQVPPSSLRVCSLPTSWNYNAKAEMLMKCKRKRNKYQQAPAYQPGPWPFNNTTNPILSQQTNCHDVQSI